MPTILTTIVKSLLPLRPLPLLRRRPLLLHLLTHPLPHLLPHLLVPPFLAAPLF